MFEDRVRSSLRQAQDQNLAGIAIINTATASKIGVALMVDEAHVYTGQYSVMAYEGSVQTWKCNPVSGEASAVRIVSALYDRWPLGVNYIVVLIDCDGLPAATITDIPAIDLDNGRGVA